MYSQQLHGVEPCKFLGAFPCCLLFNCKRFLRNAQFDVLQESRQSRPTRLQMGQDWRPTLGPLAYGMFSVDWIDMPLPGCSPGLNRLLHAVSRQILPLLFPKLPGPVSTSVNGLDSVGSHFVWIGVRPSGSFRRRSNPCVTRTLVIQYLIQAAFLEISPQRREQG